MIASVVFGKENIASRRDVLRLPWARQTACRLVYDYAGMLLVLLDTVGTLRLLSCCHLNPQKPQGRKQNSSLGTTADLYRLSTYRVRYLRNQSLDCCAFRTQCTWLWDVGSERRAWCANVSMRGVIMWGQVGADDWSYTDIWVNRRTERSGRSLILTTQSVVEILIHICWFQERDTPQVFRFAE